jgi:hypothetical protein
MEGEAVTVYVTQGTARRRRSLRPAPEAPEDVFRLKEKRRWRGGAAARTSGAGGRAHSMRRRREDAALHAECRWRQEPGRFCECCSGTKSRKPQLHAPPPPPLFYYLKKPFVHILQQLCIARSLRLYPLQQSKSLPGQINVWRAAEGGQTDLQLRAL